MLDIEDDEATCEELKKLDINIYSFSDIEKAGEEKGADIEFHTPGPDTISTIN